MKKKIESQKKEKGEIEKDNAQMKRDIENLMRRNMEISKKEKHEKQANLNRSRGSPDSRLEYYLKKKTNDLIFLDDLA